MLMRRNFWQGICVDGALGTESSIFSATDETLIEQGFQNAAISSTTV